MLKAIAKPVFARLFPVAYKRRSELSFWRGRHQAERGTLGNAHFEHLYTAAFDLTPEDFRGLRMLDIGCGPRGSLEWATMTERRVGLDPLAAKYLALGANRHAMEYVSAPSERMPFPDGYFDIVACLNALDHVDDLPKTIAEIKRVTKPGGRFLLSVETDHPPSSTEPITFDDAALATLQPEFTLETHFRVASPPDHDLHKAVRDRAPPYEPGQPGIFVGRYRRT